MSTRLEQLEKMLDERPDDPFLIYALAREYEQQSGTLQALLMYEHLVKNYPAYLATYYPYARLLYTAGNRSEGIRLLKAGIDAGKETTETHTVKEMKALLMQWEEE